MYDRRISTLAITYFAIALATSTHAQIAPSQDKCDSKAHYDRLANRSPAAMAFEKIRERPLVRYLNAHIADITNVINTYDITKNQATVENERKDARQTNYFVTMSGKTKMSVEEWRQWMGSRKNALVGAREQIRDFDSSLESASNIKSATQVLLVDLKIALGNRMQIPNEVSRLTKWIDYLEASYLPNISSVKFWVPDLCSSD